MKLELNGAPARSEDLAGAFGYGHFTAMQVRDGKVRGLDAHLHRLATSTRRMFAAEDGGTVVWPEAPVLDGITQQLVRRGLTLTGIPQEIREVRPADLPGFDAKFLTNSESVGWPVASVDDVVLPFAPETVRILTEAYERNPGDEI